MDHTNHYHCVGQANLEVNKKYERTIPPNVTPNADASDFVIEKKLNEISSKGLLNLTRVNGIIFIDKQV